MNDMGSSVTTGSQTLIGYLRCKYFIVIRDVLTLLVIRERPNTRMPQCLATVTSGTVLIPDEEIA
jgi:hypothetical protein